MSRFPDSRRQTPTARINRNILETVPSRSLSQCFLPPKLLVNQLIRNHLMQAVMQRMSMAMVYCYVSMNITSMRSSTVSMLNSMMLVMLMMLMMIVMLVMILMLVVMLMMVFMSMLTMTMFSATTAVPPSGIMRTTAAMQASMSVSIRTVRTMLGGRSTIVP